MGRQGIDRNSFSAKPDDYKLVEEVGHGASAVVYRAIYLPTKDVVAVKCLDLERCNSNLDSIQKEAQTMSLMDHPNLITSYCSFVVERYLWVIMPFMAGGSCLHIMKYSHPDGLPESVICSILKETLKALEYLHAHGHIHRDVKAGNILLDSDGMVKLGDFGVSACMFDKGDRQRTRNTFVGTPCWMAPEVMQPGGGYDFKADIWSFAITGLELAHGHAPFSKYPPMKVLLLTLQNAPPGLDYDRDKKFSKSFKEMIAMCLVKDPKKRPTATKLLKHSFFKRGKPPGLSLKKVLLDLPPIWERVKSLQLKDAAQLAQKEMPFSEQEALSQREYKKSVSGWNFDLEDLKIQASLIQDDDEVTGMMDEDQRMKVVIDEMNTSSSGSGLEMTTSFNGIDFRESTSGSEVSQPEYLNEIADFSNKENFDQTGNSELALQASENAVQGCPKMTNKSQFQKGPLNPNRDLSYSLSEKALTFQRPENKQHAISEKSKHNMLRVPSFNCTLLHPGLASMNSLSAAMRTTGGPWEPLEDSSKPSLVQVKGRFSVTSESLDLVKESCMRKSASVGDFLQDSKLLPPSHSSKEPYNGPARASSLSCCLRSLLVHISILQDCALISLNGLQQDEEEHAFLKGKPSPQHLNIENAATEEVSHFERGNPLLLKIEEFEYRMMDLIDELTVQNFKQMQLNEQRSAPNCPNEDHAQQRENN